MKTMTTEGLFKKEGQFQYLEVGEGTPIVVLHGLMGGLSNFEAIVDFYPTHNYKVVIPELPIYDMPLTKTTVKEFAHYLKSFLEYKIPLQAIFSRKSFFLPKLNLTLIIH